MPVRWSTAHYCFSRAPCTPSALYRRSSLDCLSPSSSQSLSRGPAKLAPCSPPSRSCTPVPVDLSRSHYRPRADISLARERAGARALSRARFALSLALERDRLAPRRPPVQTIHGPFLARESEKRIARCVRTRRARLLISLSDSRGPRGFSLHRAITNLSGVFRSLTETRRSSRSLSSSPFAIRRGRAPLRQTVALSPSLPQTNVAVSRRAACASLARSHPRSPSRRACASPFLSLGLSLDRPLFLTAAEPSCVCVGEREPYSRCRPVSLARLKLRSESLARAPCRGFR